MAANNDELFYYTSEADNIKVSSSGSGNIARGEDVLEDYVIKDAITREIIAGTMPINTASIVNLNCGQEHVIAKGYHDGTGKVVANSLSSQTVADALKTDIITGKTAWVNGVKIVGTLQYSAEDDATALAEDIVNTKTAYVKHNKITGTMPVITPEIRTLDPGETYIISKGYHNGTARINAKTIAELTPATASASHILIGQTAWVNGIKITGTLTKQIIIDEAVASSTANPADVFEEKWFYSKTAKAVVKGTMVSYTNMPPIVIGGRTTAQYYTVPAGYHDGSLIIKAESLQALTNDATAIPQAIYSGMTAYVNGVKITGTMDVNSGIDQHINCSAAYIIPAGYHDGTGKVTGNSLASQTTATAEASDITVGKTAWVNGNLLNGSLPIIPIDSLELDCGQEYFIPQGRHTGSGRIYVRTLAEQTAGTATAADIAEGKVAWVNGQRIVGTMVNADNIKY